jgi:phosphofructokinase-like protein
MRIAITTGGGDAPGLNAVIRAVVLAGHNLGWEVFGIRRGYRGLMTGEGVIPLGPDEVRGITHLGGTILGTTNRGNPFRWVEHDAEGAEIEVDRSDELVARFHERGFEALVAIGGDGSLHIAYQLSQKGLPIIGVPKTIDNDVAGTLRTFGFDTAMTTATEAIDKLHPTAEAHDRVMVVELMGRDTGWIALYAGVAATADVILIPEIPFDIQKVCAKINERERLGLRYSIVVVAEGARPVAGEQVIAESRLVGGATRLGGVGNEVADAIAKITGKETRCLVLGHLQRGGAPTSSDRLLGLRFGTAAVRALDDGAFGTMVCFHPPEIGLVQLAEVVGRPKLVPLDSDTVTTARQLGVNLGD